MKTPSIQTRHVLNRFSCGTTPGLVAEQVAAGGRAAWFERQLRPLRIPDDTAAGMRAWYPNLSQSPQELWTSVKSAQTTITDVSLDLARWTILQRTYSQRQLLEVMTGFWSDFLHIPSADAGSWPHRNRYDATIRAHALGRFETLLVQAVTHPAMGGYLDNARSTRVKLNENLGRELLELYSVGLEANYSEREVVDSARMLTGYHVDLFDTWQASYRTEDHYTGPLSVLGFSSANDDVDGRAETGRYIKYLANHPLTAARIAHRLCARLVSDQPSAAIVNAVAQSFRASGTDIKAALRTLVAHPDFAGSVGAKVRTPLEDVVAAYRVLGVQAHRPRTASDFANAVIFLSNCMGERPFEWPRPDGPPDFADAHTSASRMLSSWAAHNSLSGGYTPSSGVTYRAAESWLPRLPATVEEIIDHASRNVLARASTASLRNAASVRIQMPLSTRVSSYSAFGPVRTASMLASLLDSPHHMAR